MRGHSRWHHMPARVGEAWPATLWVSLCILQPLASWAWGLDGQAGCGCGRQEVEPLEGQMRRGPGPALSLPGCVSLVCPCSLALASHHPLPGVFTIQHLDTALYTPPTAALGLQGPGPGQHPCRPVHLPASTLALGLRPLALELDACVCVPAQGLLPSVLEWAPDLSGLHCSPG